MEMLNTTWSWVGHGLIKQLYIVINLGRHYYRRVSSS